MLQRVRLTLGNHIDRFAKAQKQAFLSFLAVIVAVVSIPVFAPAEKVQAAPFPECETQGILFQYPGAAPTAVHMIDMVTGIDQEPSGTPIPARQINAIGYNTQDNYIYGWDNGTGQLVQVHSDWSTTSLGLPNGYAGGTTNVYVGDIDSNGDYWFSSGTNWYQVDLTPGATFKDILASGPLNKPANTGVLGDWAFIPGKADLYTVLNDTTVNQARLWIFNRTTHTWTSPGLLPGILPHTPLTEGAMYADSQGYLYASVNSTGDIWRVNVNDTTSALLSNGQPSTNNDGARCANAALSIDFGDAPFDTMLADNGPRHEVVDYIDASHTAPLMLGKIIDSEPDGFPSAEANGDDLNNVDDEEGVAPIVAPAGSPTALSVPVTVTNTASSTATLAGWIDLDSNGTFDPGERVVQTIPANAGTAQYELVFPSATFTNDTYARFRIFTGSVADPQPTGPATAGEAEDHRVQVGSYTIAKSSTPSSGTPVSANGTVTYTVTITNTGLTDLTGLSFYDDLSDVLDDATMQGNPIVTPASAGTAVLDNDELQFIFTGDILAGQSATVAYTVKVKTDSSNDHVLRNMVVAAHSNCHPDIQGQVVSVDDPVCETDHPITTNETTEGNNPEGSLANTGHNMTLLISLASSIVTVAFVLLTRRVLGSLRN